MTPWAVLTIGYHLTSRLAYVVWVGIALTRQQRDRLFTARDGVDAGFRRFQRRAARLMANDAVSFVLLGLVTRDSLHVGIPRDGATGIGALLIVAGIGTKVWAARTLGRQAYYWHNFFAADPPAPRHVAGPYRYLENPMYTVGYLQAYGFALAVGSLPGLVMALIDQAAILTFHSRVEKPHDMALRAAAAAAAPVAAARAL